MNIKQILQTVQTMAHTLTQRSQTRPAHGLAVRTGVRAGSGVDGGNAVLSDILDNLPVLSGNASVSS